MAHDALHDLELLFRSRHGLVHIVAREDRRAEGLLAHVADRLTLPLFTWSRASGLRRLGRTDFVYDTADPVKALRHVASAELEAVYVFSGLATGLEGQDLLVSVVREAAQQCSGHEGAVVLVSDDAVLPDALVRLAARVELPGPTDAEFAELLSAVVRDLSRARHVEVSLSAREHRDLVTQLSGLTLMEAEKALTKAIVEDGALTATDIRHVLAAKREIVEREGVLEYTPAVDDASEIAGLRKLGEWLEKRAAVVRDPEGARRFGLGFPKGVLLLGVPGCGKSLSAKAVAGAWGLPLLKLDPSGLYNKFIGETERNFRRAMRAAERMAPVVLWIDEIEKALARGGGEEDGGVSERVLGIFLTWLQERSGDVFVVATANDVRRLPPELLRKGRFDEIFFVDLPPHEVRERIFGIHLEGRGHPAGAFDLADLATRTEGFSGSEIEEVVVAALYTAFARGTPLDAGILAEEIASTRPLSVTMRERIEEMRRWARGRTVPAD